MLETENARRFLLCRIGASVGALPLENVREILRPLPIEPLAGMPSFVLGLAIIRGFATPIVDSNRLLGCTSASDSSRTRLVLLKLGERAVALAVDGAVDVRTLPTDVLSEVPPLLSASGTDCISAVGTLDAELLLVLEASRLIPETIWAAIATEGTAT